MPFHTPKTSSKSFDPPPSGSHIGRLVQLIDEGTHEDTYQGEVRDRRTVRLTFELPTEKKVFVEEKGEQPYFISRSFTLSMHKKSAFRQFVQVWRGVPFTEDEANSFDVETMLGAAALLSISHNDKDGKVYANLDSAMRLPKGMVCPPIISEKVMIHLDNLGDGQTTQAIAKLPEFLRKKIEASSEYRWYASQMNRPVSKGFPPIIADEEDPSIPF